MQNYMQFVLLFTIFVEHLVNGETHLNRQNQFSLITIKMSFINRTNINYILRHFLRIDKQIENTKTSEF